MKTAVWIAMGVIGVTFWSSVAACCSWGHVMPDAAVMTVAFLSMRRDPLPLVVSAVALGYIVGRQALAPVGLHETALAVCAIGVQLVAGHLAGSGALFFAAVAGASVAAYHGVLAILLSLGGSEIGFSSWATALSIPSGAVTLLLALVSYPVMIRVEQLVSPARTEGLSWH